MCIASISASGHSKASNNLNPQYRLCDAFDRTMALCHNLVERFHPRDFYPQCMRHIVVLKRGSIGPH
jgi:hypothetical protein